MRCRPSARSPFDMRTQPIDLLSLSGHKLHGPKGVGALYVREGIELWPLLPGGGQERGRRSGTENVAAIVGTGQGGGTRRRRAIRRGRATGPHPRPHHREHPGEDRQCLLDRPSLAPLARAYLPRFRRHGRRGDQAVVGVGQARALPFRRAARAARSMPASLPTCWRPWGSIRSRPAARCGFRWGGSIRWKRPTGSWKCCPGPWLRCGRSAGWQKRDNVSRGERSWYKRRMSNFRDSIAACAAIGPATSCASNCPPSRT